LDLRERFLESLLERDTEFLAVLRVSRSAGVESVKKYIGLGEEESEQFIGILFESIDGVLQARGVEKDSLPIIAAGKVVRDALGPEGPFTMFPTEFLASEQAIKVLVELVSEEVGATPEMAAAIRAEILKALAERERDEER
jgi:hypothetical protein